MKLYTHLNFGGNCEDAFRPIRSSYLDVDSAEAAETIYSVLAVGGETGMPIAETFFASRFRPAPISTRRGGRTIAELNRESRAVVAQ